MNEEEFKDLRYPVVVNNDNGAIVGELVDDFQEGLFKGLVELGMLSADLGDIIDYQSMENKYGQDYSVYDNEDELLAEGKMEDLV